MRVVFSIKRYNPEMDGGGWWRDYELDLEPESRVLDGLIAIKDRLDGSLAFRRSCAHGVCGSDALVINGEERLACKTLLKNLIGEGGEPLRVTVEPLYCLPVERDLMVDQKAFFERYRGMKPFLINEEPAGERERPQSPAEREKYADATKCILCAACFSACPIEREKNPRFIGPAAIVNAARFVFDNRDRGLVDRLPALDRPDGVWACENKFRCTQVCPRGILVTKNINLTKRKIDEWKKQHAPGEGNHG